MKKLLSSAFFLTIISITSNVYADEPYTLNPGDRLFISVWNEEALQKEVIILPDSTISFPLAGQFNTQGRTVIELEDELKAKLSDYISDPVVNITVNAVAGNTVHIIGKVLRPGSFSMSQPLDAMQALSLAGGLNTFAEENNIIILRRNGDKQEIIPVHYARIKKGQSLDSNVMLKSGDVIIIP
ncbi:polysaccharide export protein [Methylophaga sp. SB9B]|uniref:polysaccharide biosynthesis/export family protein n=1 Tax=Methylophaga sp. SB9B TaxID=2570356 RepID=UPI0010A8C32E|nr:polysaccharide biosynthesis/export family protein [Methylophaga sp. SB9B]THK43074.1 polysaccharide export protein [Methylophaga sp. SB9B]